MITPILLWCWRCPICYTPNVMGLIDSSESCNRYTKEYCNKCDVMREIEFPDLGSEEEHSLKESLTPLKAAGAK